jgi:hypothetical protein
MRRVHHAGPGSFAQFCAVSRHFLRRAYGLRDEGLRLKILTCMLLDVQFEPKVIHTITWRPNHP